MKTKGLLSGILLAAILVFQQPAIAVETIDWEVLVPPLDFSKDPFSRLSKRQSKSLRDLLRARELRVAGNTTDALNKYEKFARSTLDADGIDADQILKENDEFQKMLEVNASKLVGELNGKTVKIAGYILPIEFSGTRVTEFLLVPHVGACIHTPPPPANQLVHVKVDGGFDSDGLYMPVWVTGQIGTSLTSQAVSFADGEADVEAGYSMVTSDVVPYE
jgi:uncharacterized protein